MSEKRFIIVKSIENLYALVDKERKGKEQILIFSLHKEQLGVVCDLLNEQQATNDYLEEANSRLQIQLGETLRLVDKLKEENEQLRQELKDIKENPINYF